MRFFLIILVFPSLAFSQKIIKDEIDPINGTRKLELKSVVLNAKLLSPNYLALSLNKFWIKVDKEADTSILISFIAKAYTTTTYGKGYKFFLKFSDGSIIEKKCLSDTEIATENAVISVSAYLTAEDIAIISQKELVFIRIETRNANNDYNIDKEKAQEFAKNIIYIDAIK